MIKFIIQVHKVQQSDITFVESIVSKNRSTVDECFTLLSSLLLFPSLSFRWLTWTVASMSYVIAKVSYTLYLSFFLLTHDDLFKQLPSYLITQESLEPLFRLVLIDFKLQR